MKLDQDPTYQVYLLRLWQERPASPKCPPVWRYSVENIRTHRRYGFGSLEELIAFFRTRSVNTKDEYP
ncbi:MAG: hypothetical protein JW953_14520 [Anaerolineae bacterium]|nr:hypothetical protein [Anaerolineae bacterium]